MKKKQQKKTIYILIGVIILCLISFFVGKNYQTPQKTISNVKLEKEIIQPPLAPIRDTVKRIDGDMIVVTGKAGELLLPKDSSKVTVFRNTSSGRQKATFDDVKVGASVTVYILIPGKQAELVIE